MSFYVTMVFLGIVLIVFSLVWVVLDKKKIFTFNGRFEDKKQELVEIINDAEQMIDELNRFSDYIVTQMDLKNEELRVNLKNAGEEIENLDRKARAIKEGIREGLSREEERESHKEAAVVNGALPKAEKAAHHPQKPVQTIKTAEKVVHINNRYSEVLRLAGSGLEGAEIAKTLNMGKGEVELILGINRN